MHIRKKDIIGIVAPSAPISNELKKQFDNGISFLKNYGFKIKYSKNLFSNKLNYSATPKEKADDINGMFKDKNIYYGLVLVWAYSGIWLKHTSQDGFNSNYPNIINIVIFCIALFVISIGYLSYKKTRK